MTTFKRLIITLIILALSLLSLGLYWRHRRLEQQLLEERDVAAKVALELEGFRLAQISNDLSTITPTLAPVVKRVREAGATPAVATHTIYERVEVEVPGACPPSPDTSIPVLELGAEHEFVLALTPKGTPYHTSKLFVDYSIGSSEGRVELPESKVNTNVVLSKDVQDAFIYWSDRPSRMALFPRPLKSWRLGWTVGVGPMYTYDQHITAGVAVLWGAQL